MKLSPQMALRMMALSYAISAASSYFSSRVSGLTTLQGTLLYGTVFGLTFIGMASLRLNSLRVKSYLLTLILRTAVYAVTVIVAFVIAISLNVSLRENATVWDSNIQAILRQIFTSPFLLVPGCIAVATAFLVSSLQAIATKLGPGVMSNWMRGYYHEPREEVRIFMFVDMKDSTGIAERLGHMKFSALIRDFMADLTPPVLSTKAEVSHYIGDEAVLTWQMKNGLQDANVLRFFYLFEARLRERADYYRKANGFVPEFKAGAHYGSVVTTEVGEVKSEIVFHGDVLNTAARIQSLCNKLEQAFLISGELAGQLPFSPDFRIELLGEKALKGRVRHVSVCAVSRVEQLLTKS